jgi:hypothetical protein
VIAALTIAPLRKRGELDADRSAGMAHPSENATTHILEVAKAMLAAATKRLAMDCRYVFGTHMRHGRV